MPLTQLMCAAAGVVCQLRIVLMGLQNTTAGPVATDILAILGALTPPACRDLSCILREASSVCNTLASKMVAKKQPAYQRGKNKMRPFQDLNDLRQGDKYY
uniref:Putative secreted protein n=1 Tax=Amblyomma americanum TaxID=6943 RepID=A0A0C9R3T8_AMBAM